MSAFQVHDVVTLAADHAFRGEVVTAPVTSGREWWVSVRETGHVHYKLHPSTDLRLYSRPAPHVEPRVPVIIPEPITVPGQWAVTVKMTSADAVLSFSPIGGDS